MVSVVPHFLPHIFICILIKIWTRKVKFRCSGPSDLLALIFSLASLSPFSPFPFLRTTSWLFDWDNFWLRFSEPQMDLFLKARFLDWIFTFFLRTWLSDGVYLHDIYSFQGFYWFLSFYRYYFLSFIVNIVSLGLFSYVMNKFVKNCSSNMQAWPRSKHNTQEMRTE